MRVWHLLLFVALLGTVIWGYLTSPAWGSTYLIKEATIAQVEQMVQADPDNGVGYRSANLLAQGSNLLEVTFDTSYFDKEKVAEFLDSIGVQYYGIK